MSKGDWKAALFIGCSVGMLALIPLYNLNLIFHWYEGLGVVIFSSVLSPVLLWIFFVVGSRFPVVAVFGKFAAVGTLNSLLDLAVLNGLIMVSGIAIGIGFTAWKTIAFIIAKNSSYVWNKWWVFENRERAVGKEYGFFVAFTVIGGIINVGVASVLVNFVEPFWGMGAEAWANLAAVTAILVSMFWNFFSYRNIVFKS